MVKKLTITQPLLLYLLFGKHFRRWGRGYRQFLQYSLLAVCRVREVLGESSDMFNNSFEVFLAVLLRKVSTMRRYQNKFLVLQETHLNRTCDLSNASV